SNVIMKDCTFDGTYHVLLFKMRPDTPQQYRNVLVDGATGTVRNAVEVQTWKQFFDKVERDPMPMSIVDNVTFRNAHLVCTRNFYRDRKTDDYILSNFTFSDIIAESPDITFDLTNISNPKTSDVSLRQTQQ
ncbi:MAG: exopolygalacturonase, partial [Muribaculaceae bacterium]|nr:exopolygalacturonase [Muribaculaceae bacterium]